MAMRLPDEAPLDVGGIRQPKRRAFLHAYARLGNVSEAARAVGIDRDNHYLWVNNDERYAEAFAQAHEIAIDSLEQEARRRAVLGVTEPVFYRGEQVAEVQKYSDTLLIFLMKGARPDKYRDNARIEHTGAGGGPVQVSVDIKADLFAKIGTMAANLATPGFTPPGLSETTPG